MAEANLGGTCNLKISTGYMGLQSVHLHGAPGSETCHVWGIMLCVCCLEILNIFTLCFVSEVISDKKKHATKAWSLDSHIVLPHTWVGQVIDHGSLALAQ